MTNIELLEMIADCAQKAALLHFDRSMQCGLRGLDDDAVKRLAGQVKDSFVPLYEALVRERKEHD
jgi:hypothetical protein